MDNFLNPDSPDPMDFRFCVGGLEVFSNCPSNLSRKGFADLKIRVMFLDPEAGADTLSEHTPSGWYLVPGEAMPKILLHPDGNKAVVYQSVLDLEASAVAIRRLVPFASALQGAVILHASAVIINGKVVCFIAGSGSGKSTLAFALRDIGYPLICDDLLPCRYQDGVITIPYLSDNLTTMLKMSMICFLCRDAALTTPKLKAISMKECMELLLFNGFGELEEKTIWKRQFETYSYLSSTIKAFRLTIPDNISLLSETASKLSAQLEIMTRIDH
jgi:hypothetical protein